MTNRQPRPQFRVLKDLGPDVVTRVDDKLRSGDSPEVVGKYLQNELGLLEGHKLPALKKMLTRYKATELKTKTIERIAEAQLKTTTSAVLKRQNAMEKLENLVDRQQKRFAKILEREEKIPNGILLKDVTREATTLHGMLVDLARLQLETGVMHRVAKTIKSTVTDQSGEVKEFSWSETQEQLYQLLERQGHVLAEH